MRMMTDAELRDDLAAAEAAVKKLWDAVNVLRTGGSDKGCSCGKFGKPGLCAWHVNVYQGCEDARRALAMVREDLDYPNGRPDAAGE